MVKNNTFEVYAPLTKSIDDSTDDGVLIITGVASTTNQDLTGDIIQETAIQSMKEQAVTKNLHGDHQYGLFNGLIGTITEVLDTDDSTLSIKAKILPKYAEEIKTMLDIGVNLGFSIGGYVTDYTPQKEGGWLIDGFDLMEISLTGMPANWDTFGTITTSKGIVKSKCLTKACVETIKIKEAEKMVEENNEVTITEEDIKNIATDLFNELMSEKQEEIVKETVDMVKDQVEKIVEDKINDDNNNDEDNEPATDDGNTGEGEAKTNNPVTEEDKEKALADLIGKAVEDQMSVFFNHLEKNRNPQPKIDEIEEAPEVNKSNSMTLEEIAKNMNANAMSNAIADQLNQL